MASPKANGRQKAEAAKAAPGIDWAHATQRLREKSPKPGIVTGQFKRHDLFKLPEYAPGVLGKNYTAAKLAMDDASLQIVASSWQFANIYAGLWAEGIGFMGYPYLAELSQRSEYRRASEVMAEEMTRKWLKIRAIGHEDKADKVSQLEAAMKRFGVRETFRDAVQYDGFYGMAHVQIDVGTNDDDVEINTPLTLSDRKIKKGSLRAFRLIDPTWTAPINYNAADPLSAFFYKPQNWFVMGRQIHASRMLTIISRPVPDILKAAYNFGGLSMSQLIKPYVDNWLRTRQSVSDLISAFSVWVLSTDMMAAVQVGSPTTPQERAEFFALLKDNFGLMMVDKEREAFMNVAAPLGSLDQLQAQTQEHIAAAAGQPLVKFCGIQPAGLNASSDGEIRVWYDAIAAKQERILTPPLTTVLKVLQLHEFGEIDENITLEWVPLYELDAAGKASVRKIDADRDAVLIGENVITNDEARTRIASDPEDPYAGLEGDAPEPVTPPELAPGSNMDPSEHIASAGAAGSTSGANATT